MAFAVAEPGAPSAAAPRAMREVASAAGAAFIFRLRRRSSAGSSGNLALHLVQRSQTAPAPVRRACSCGWPTAGGIFGARAPGNSRPWRLGKQRLVSQVVAARACRAKPGRPGSPGSPGTSWGVGRHGLRRSRTPPAFRCPTAWRSSFRDTPGASCRARAIWVTARAPCALTAHTANPPQLYERAAPAPKVGGRFPAAVETHVQRVGFSLPPRLRTADVCFWPEADLRGKSQLHGRRGVSVGPQEASPARGQSLSCRACLANVVQCDVIREAARCAEARRLRQPRAGGRSAGDG
jgi:hypothetical protein